MGWMNCGSDTQGRPIGYGFAATCDAPGCDVEIDRGLSYACGGMHGYRTDAADFDVCEKYFCESHRVHLCVGDVSVSVCRPCKDEAHKHGLCEECGNFATSGDPKEHRDDCLMADG